MLVAVALLFYFIRFSEHCDSSLTVPLISNMFMICGIDTQLVLMESYVVYFTTVFELEYESLAGGSFLVTSMLTKD